ncbi:MAG TPA: Flp pilus assembly protein CpaB [Pyrinomonadaceae bacterium]|jgi:Flp pilus assembly protein CpaB|nr:Flp pilus assembly protein CpaB [Pyrinomonadaceae bacterium]
MRNKRLILALTGAVLCGVLGVTLVTRYIASAQQFTKDLNNVVVAKTEIPLGAKIVAEQLSFAPIPNGSTPEGVFRKMEEVVGRVAVTPIGVREPITNMKLAPEGVGAGLTAVIPEGYRAMTVKVDDVVGVSGFVMPGSYVDVVAVILPVAQGAAAGGPISKIVLQNIKVLASGAKIDSPSDQRQPSDVKAVTLQVTPQQAEKLVLATNEGKLQLVMRNYGDQEDTTTTGANKASLLGGDTAKPDPGPTSEKATDTKPGPTRPRVKRSSAIVAQVQKPATSANRVSRNTIELIEGSKRRDVDIP